MPRNRREQRKRLETIEDELEDVKRKLGRIWHFVETTDIDMADASDRIKEHRERQERLKDAAADAHPGSSSRSTEPSWDSTMETTKRSRYGCKGRRIKEIYPPIVLPTMACLSTL